MEKKRKTRSSLMLFKRRSQLIEQESNITLINLAQLYETFKDNQIDFNLLSSLMKLSKIQNKKNIDKDSNDTLISRVMENMKKKNLFYFFLNFYKIDDNTLIKIIPYLSYEYYKKNSHLFHENDFSNKFYFIIKGFVSFHKNEIVTDSEKNSSIVDAEKFILGPDKYFGELDLIYDQKKSTSAFCKTDCHLITLKKEIFDKYLQDKISKIELKKKLFIFSFFRNFSNIPNMRMEKIFLNNVKTLFFRNNKIIYKSGENNNSLYLIYKGEAIIINDIKKGEFSYLKNFGENIGSIQKKANGLNYVDIIKNTQIKNNEKILFDKENNKNVNNDIELNDLNLLLNKIKYDIICRMTKGAVGGLEIVTGINKFKYSLLSNSDFTCVIKIELKNMDDYLSNFMINLIPVFVKFEKNIHERIKNMKLIDESITPQSVKKLKKEKKNLVEKKVEEENDKIYKRNIKKIDDSFQLNYGGFIKNNQFNYNLYQKKEHFKDLLKNNKKKILKIEKFLKSLDIEEKMNLKYSAIKMQNFFNFENFNKNKKNDIAKVSSFRLIKNKYIRRFTSKNSIKENSKINSDKKSIDEKIIKIKRFKKPKLYWKFVDINTKPIKKQESNKNVHTFFVRSDEENKKKKNHKNLLFETQSLSIDYDFKKKVFVCENPHKPFKNKCRYKTKELFFLTPKKSKTTFKYNSETKEEEKILRNKNIKILKKFFLYDTGNFDIPLLSEENSINYK